ncbi:MAG: hypothetical protein KIT43_06640 [Bauldia sp.]|nr:hypothetical protein [Bauldia sp.]
MTLHTLGAAARQTGIGARTLRKAVQSGLLPARRIDGWVYQIHSSDLARFSLARQVDQMTSAARERRDIEQRPAPIIPQFIPSRGPLHRLRTLLAGLGVASAIPARNGGRDS